MRLLEPGLKLLNALLQQLYGILTFLKLRGKGLDGG